MKTLMVILTMVLFMSCSSITDPLEPQTMTGVYTLPYYRHYDPDTRFFSVNPIDTIGVLREVKFYAYNFGDSVKYGADPTVYFSFFISQHYDNRFSDSDTLYFSPYLSTENDTEFTVILNKEFDGQINVHINRYETFKPIDFRCEIKYFIK